MALELRVTQFVPSIQRCHRPMVRTALERVGREQIRRSQLPANLNRRRAVALLVTPLVQQVEVVAVVGRVALAVVGAFAEVP